MIIVQNTIVSDDIADRRFCCNLGCCKGACCVDGDSGAPLMEDEVPLLEAILPEVEPYMTEEGIAAVREQSVAVRDKDGDLGTPLISSGACAYAFNDKCGTGCEEVTLCAIERAYRNAPHSSILDNYPKPVSCHLYPIRVQDYGEFTAVNYHQWDICHCAKDKGEPLYVYLREPLIRRFGQEWYDELLQEIENRNS